MNTVKMESYEYNFCLCAVNIGILLYIKLFKGIRIMKHIMLVFIFINNSRKMTMFVHILPEISLHKVSNDISNIDRFVSIQISYAGLSPSPVILHIKFDQDWPTGLRDIQVRT